eukprot:2568830-Pyramimonas_sp.AAC.1
METKRRICRMYVFAHRYEQRQPTPAAPRNARTPSRRGPNTSLNICGACQFDVVLPRTKHWNG